MEEVEDIYSFHPLGIGFTHLKNYTFGNVS
jgi:hypothetical protein